MAARVVEHRWTEERIDDLIGLFEDRPCLYNTKSKDYYNRDRRRKAFDEIAAALEVTVDEIQKKLKSLRTQYGRERQKAGKLKSGDGLGDVYTSKWPHFDKLRFLDDFVTAKQGISNFKDESVGENIVLDEEEETLLETSPKQPPKKPTKRQKIEAAEKELLKKAIECMDQTKGEAGTSVDGFELFGRYAATELRAIMNPQSQRWAKLQVQTILYSAGQSDTFSQHPPDAPYPYGYPPMLQADRSVATHNLSMSPTSSYSSTS